MTTLAITPNWKNKGAKFKGTVAAGEHVSVAIQNDDGEGGEFIADASTLRLRVVDPANGRTLAIFPEPVPEGETPEEWDSDLSPLRCTLNLNTVQMLKAVPPAANVPLLFVLDDYENKTLYFKEQFPVEHWPRLRGEEEPTDLDNYKDIIADFNGRLDGYDTRITAAENVAQAASTNASTAISTANQAVSKANQAIDKAETAQNSAAASAEAAHNSALAAEEAQEAAESAAESINSPDATLTEEGVAADAKAAGEAIAAEETRATAAEAAEETRAKGVEGGLRTDLTAAQKAIDDEAVLRAAADADLEANKADKATTYTKTEVDTKVAGYVNGAEYDSDEKKILLKHGTTTVAEIDATDFIKDGMVSSVEIEDGNLVITFNTDAGKDPISIPLTDIFNPNAYYDKTAADARFATKADATLTALAFSDWIFAEGGQSIEFEFHDYSNGQWHFGTDNPAYPISVYITAPADATHLTWTYNDQIYSADRHAIGYTLGSQSDKPLASEAEAEALRSGKLDKADVVAPSTSSSDSGKAADAKATGDALAGKLGNSGRQTLNGPLEASAIKVVWDGNYINLFLDDGGQAHIQYNSKNILIQELAGTLALLQNLAPDFSTSATYALNALCVYQGVLYRCTTAVTTAGAWTGSTNWTVATLEDVLAALRTALDGKLSVGSDGAVTTNVRLTGMNAALLATVAGGAVVGNFMRFRFAAASAEYYIAPAYNANTSKYGFWVKHGENDAGTFYALADLAPLASPALTGTPTAPNIASGASDSQIANKKYVDDSIAGADPTNKLNSTAAAPAFRSGNVDTSYQVSNRCTYNGVIYECMVAYTATSSSPTPDQDIYDGTATPATGHWKVTDMTSPDATLDVTATDKLLRLVATNGDVIWSQGYNLSTTSSATVLTEQVSAFTFAADAAADQAIVLPTVAAGKVGDFILDVTNLSANDRSLTLTGLDTAFSVVVKAGDDLSETLTVAAGEMARYYFTMTAFRVNSLPTWQVAKEAVENGGAQS